MCFLFDWLSYFCEFSSRHPAISLVLIGVIGEGVEIVAKLFFEHWYKKHEKKFDKIGAVFWIVVVIGLALEIPDAAKVERENANLNREAGDARKMAGQANERASITESNNLVLRKQLDIVELEARDRIITEDKKKDFIFLMEKTPKIPIIIDIGDGIGETESFGFQIRQLLSAAGFPIMPTLRDANMDFGRGIAETNLPSVYILINTGTTNKVIFFDGETTEETNGFERPVVSKKTTGNVYKAIETGFNQINIITRWKFNQKEGQIGDCEIFILPKSN